MHFLWLKIAAWKESINVHKESVISIYTPDSIASSLQLMKHDDTMKPNHAPRISCNPKRAAEIHGSDQPQ